MKSRKHKHSLKLYLAAAFLVFSAILLIIMWLFQTVFLDSFYKWIKTSQVKSCTSSVAYNIENTDRLYYDILPDIEDRNNMFVSIYNTSSSIFTPIYKSDNRFNLYSQIQMSKVYYFYRTTVDSGGSASFTKQKYFLKSADENPGISKNDSDENISPASPGEFEIEDFARPSLERENMSQIAYTKIVKTDAAEYFIIIESEVTPVTSVVDTLRYQLIIITVIVIIISIFIAVLIARSISKPISKTNEKAKSLANQNYDIEFGDTRYKELYELNNTLTFAASELKKVDDLRKELIANISHDLRTPLTMIIGYSEVMRDLPGENTAENIQIIIDEANRLNLLVSDLLDISKLESGTAQINKAPFCLTDCINKIFERYTKLIEQEDYHIIFEHERDAFVFADELKITQVLYNLINNAINYIGEDKTVIVRQTVQNGKVRIDIIDHGEGIEGDKLDYIWDRYYKIDKEHRQAKVGTGLGLSIVKNILLAHNAEFGVKSAPNKGSDFYFIIDEYDKNSL